MLDLDIRGLHSDTIIIEALSGSSLLECSSPENCGSASESESELTRSRIRAGIWGCLVGGAMLTASVALRYDTKYGVTVSYIYWGTTLSPNISLISL